MEAIAAIFILIMFFCIVVATVGMVIQLALSSAVFAVIVSVIPAILTFLFFCIFGRAGKNLSFKQPFIVLLAIEILLVIGWLFFPIHLDVTAGEEIVSAEVSGIFVYHAAEDTYEKWYPVTDSDQVHRLKEMVEQCSYRHTLERFLPTSEDITEREAPYSIRFLNADGEMLEEVRFYPLGAVALERGKHDKYYRACSPVFSDAAIKHIDGEIEQRETKAQWQPFADALFNSVTYREAENELSFTIPENAYDDCMRLYVKTTGMLEYDGEQAFESGKLVCLKEEQETQEWIPGHTYTIQLGNTVLDSNVLELMVCGTVEFALDLLPYLPEESVYKTK